MHKNNFISSFCQFMRSITDFQSKHVDTYFIVKEQIQFLKEILKEIFFET